LVLTKDLREQRLGDRGVHLRWWVSSAVCPVFCPPEVLGKNFFFVLILATMMFLYRGADAVVLLDARSEALNNPLSR
jgi:hypothetical protein